MLPHWKQDDIVVNGVKIHYTRTGDGTKPPLVLAHGFSDNGLCWLPVACALEDEYDVILPDARGHGLSQRVQPGETIDMAADLAGLIQALGLNRPVVGGHSMGANTTAVMAARYPDIARALLLEDPPWFAPKPPDPEPNEEQEPPRNDFEVWLTVLKEKPCDEIIAETRPQQPLWPDIEWQPWAESKVQLDLNIFKVQHMWDAWADWNKTAEAIQVPTLLITADPEKGAIVHPEMARRAEELSACIKAVRISGAGHSIRRENFADYMKAVREFLAGVR